MPRRHHWLIALALPIVAGCWQPESGPKSVAPKLAEADRTLRPQRESEKKKRAFSSTSFEDTAEWLFGGLAGLSKSLGDVSDNAFLREKTVSAFGSLLESHRGEKISWRLQVISVGPAEEHRGKGSIVVPHIVSGEPGILATCELRNLVFPTREVESLRGGQSVRVVATLDRIRWTADGEESLFEIWLSEPRIVKE